MDVVTDAPCRFKTPTGTITLGVDIAPAARTLTEGNLTILYCSIIKIPWFDKIALFFVTKLLIKGGKIAINTTHLFRNWNSTTIFHWIGWIWLPCSSNPSRLCTFDTLVSQFSLVQSG